jgi:hypothetical protein
MAWLFFTSPLTKGDPGCHSRRSDWTLPAGFGQRPQWGKGRHCRWWQGRSATGRTSPLTDEGGKGRFTAHSRRRAFADLHLRWWVELKAYGLPASCAGDNRTPLAMPRAAEPRALRHRRPHRFGWPASISCTTYSRSCQPANRLRHPHLSILFIEWLSASAIRWRACGGSWRVRDMKAPWWPSMWTAGCCSCARHTGSGGTCLVAASSPKRRRKQQHGASLPRRSACRRPLCAPWA